MGPSPQPRERPPLPRSDHSAAQDHCPSGALATKRSPKACLAGSSSVGLAASTPGAQAVSFALLGLHSQVMVLAAVARPLIGTDTP